MKMNDIYQVIQAIASLVMCHCIGDYVLQIDFIAKMKCTSKYHLFVHCVLYCVPFVYVFGYQPWIFLIFFTHYAIDSLKISDPTHVSELYDQFLHYLILFIILPIIVL